MKIKDQSKVIKITEKILAESNTGDISQYAHLLGDVMKRVYTTSLLSEIADVQPLNGPTGKIATVFSGYGGKNVELTMDGSTILELTSSAGFTVGGAINTAAATGTISYLEGNFVLVKVLTGTFVKNASTTGTVTVIKDVITNRIYASKVFKNYTISSETEDKMAILKPKLVLKSVTAKTRKIKSIFTTEMADDLKAMFDEDYLNDFLVNEFAAEIVQEIDSEAISLLKTVAKPGGNIVLKNSYAISGGDLSGLSADLYLNIYKAAMEISSTLKRKQNIFVIADPKTAALLMLNQLHLFPQTQTENSYFLGTIGNLYHLYVDPFATSEYVLVGYSDFQNGTGDSGLFFAPYTNTIWDASEGDVESTYTHIINMFRYDMTIHPQDRGTGTADSDFFKIFTVDSSAITNNL